MRRRTAPSFRALHVVGLFLVMLVTACVDLGPAPTTTPPSTVGQSSPSPTAHLTATPAETAPPARTPTSTPSTRPGLTPTPTGPAATMDPALAAQIDEVISQVPPIRGLDALSPVPYEFVTREQFRDDLIELAFEEIPEETLAAEERLLKRLGLLPDDADLRQLLVDLYGAQVAAFYRPDTKRFYIIARDEPFGATDKIIVAHEYTHALQDQHFDLEGTRIKELSQGDSILGQLAGIEGDATLTMQLWAQANLSPQELFEVLFGSIGQLNDPTLANMPPILRRQLEFPYVDGMAFVQDVHGSGGFEAVNELLQDPPESTEQILHPEKYYADEQPVDFDLGEHPALGNGWQASYEQTLGELLMQVWAAGDETPEVLVPGFPVAWPHAEAVDGWGGDGLKMYEHSDGRWAIVWATVWDTGADASEFAARAQELKPTLGGPSEVQYITETPPDRTVNVVVASDQETLDLLTGQ